MNDSLSSLFSFVFLFSCALLALLVPSAACASAAAAVSSPFLYSFDAPGTLPEAGSAGESWSPYFWVNSGAYLWLEDGLGKTVQGALPASDPWRALYGNMNPLDTGGGFYPQNLFRLVTRSRWTDAAGEVQFKIQHTNLTDTPNRGGFSGVLLMSRYADGDTLYYAGVRMDGTAVIKKKYRGVYYTLDQKTVWPGVYDKWKNPNLIPQGRWMRMKFVSQNQPDGSVALTLYLDQWNTSAYAEAARAVDRTGVYGGTSIIAGPGYAGIRTDYQDVFMNDYKLTAL